MDEDVAAQLEEWWEAHRGSITEDYEYDLRRMKMGQLVTSMAVLSVFGFCILEFKMLKNLMTGMGQMNQVLTTLVSAPMMDIPIPQQRHNGRVDETVMAEYPGDIGKPFDPGVQEAPEWIKEKLSTEQVDPTEPMP